MINSQTYKKATFAECMRICQLEEKDYCLSVTFFPGKQWYESKETFNCFLHKKRCHEDDQTRSMSFFATLRNNDNAQVSFSLQNME